MESADVLFNSQLALARGYNYLYKIEKERIEGPRGGVSYRAKKPELVTAQYEIEAYLMGLVDETDIDDGPGATYYYIVTKDPSNMAIDSIFDRTFGKSVANVEINATLQHKLTIDPKAESLIDEIIGSTN